MAQVKFTTCKIRPATRVHCPAPRPVLRMNVFGLTDSSSKCLARARAVQAASTDTDASSTTAADAAFSVRLSLITRISAAVEHQATVRKFEQLSGRAAMVGVVTTLLIELVADTPVVGMSMREGAVYLAIIMLVVCTSAIFAGLRRRKLGGLLLEAVVASLTSVQRSASSLTSVTPNSLDETVDLVLDMAFDHDMTEFLESSLAAAEANSLIVSDGQDLTHT